MKYLLDDEYDFDFKVFGISCHEKDYRICWALNQALNLPLQKEEKDIEVIIKRSNRHSLHSMFTHQDADNEIEYRLISNRSTMGYLIPEKQQADYLFLITDNYLLDFPSILQSIRSIPFVLTIFEVDVSTLKSKENLIF